MTLCVLLLAGCQLPATTKAAARRNQIDGTPFYVAAPLATVARHWDESASKGLTLFGGDAGSSLQLWGDRAEIVEGPPGAIRGLIELEASGTTQTKVTAYEPGPPLAGRGIVHSWLDVIRSTPEPQKTP